MAEPNPNAASGLDPIHGARIRMLLDGPEKGSWVAYCLDCDWTDGPMPSRAAGHAADQHEREADTMPQPDHGNAAPSACSPGHMSCRKLARTARAGVANSEYGVAALRAIYDLEHRLEGLESLRRCNDVMPSGDGMELCDLWPNHDGPHANAAGLQWRAK